MTTEFRRRLVLVLAVVAVSFLSLALVARLQQDEEPAGQGADYLDCLPLTTPTTVGQINKFITKTRSAPGFVGGDVGASTKLSDGRSLWVFGDTLRPAESPGPTMVRNSMLLMGNGCAAVYRPADHGAAVPDRDDGVGYWPMSVKALPGPDGDRVAVGLMRVRSTGSGIWDFEIIGSSVARFEVAPGEVPHYMGVRDLGPDVSGTQSPLWGAAFEVVGDQVYVYGTANPGEPYVFGYSLHVARTSVEDHLDVDAWEYWDGTGWVDDPNAVATLIPAESGVSRVLSIFRQDGSWYAVSKRLDFLGDELVVWKAPSPTGPFVASEPVADLPTDDKVLQYMPLAHPDLLPEDGKVVVSWSVNAMNPRTLEKEPRLYRPEFLQIDLP